MNGNPITAEVREVKQKSEFEAMAVRAISKLKVLQEQRKEQAEELKESMLQDKEYGDLDQKIKELNEKKKRAKDRLLASDDEIKEQAANLKDTSDELKETKQSVSEYLMEYKRETGKREITDENGVQLTIFEVNSVK